MHRSKLNIAGLLLTFALLVGCQGILNTAKVTSDAVIVNEIIRSGEPLRIIKSANISEDEMTVINNALVQYDAFRDKWWAAFKEPLQRGATMIALKADYTSIVAQYDNVKTIVQSHIEDFDESQVMMLESYQARAEAMHKNVMALIEEGEKHFAMAIAVDSVLIMSGMIR